MSLSRKFTKREILFWTVLLSVTFALTLFNLFHMYGSIELKQVLKTLKDSTFTGNIYKDDLTDHYLQQIRRDKMKLKLANKLSTAKLGKT